MLVYCQPQILRMASSCSTEPWICAISSSVTAEGLRKLEDELENLRSVKRQEVAERIKVAISYGDISENSE